MNDPNGRRKLILVALIENANISDRLRNKLHGIIGESASWEEMKRGVIHLLGGYMDVVDCCGEDSHELLNLELRIRAIPKG